MLSGGISSSAMRIAGQVRPQAKPSATSIRVAVVSVLGCGACTPAPCVFLLESGPEPAASLACGSIGANPRGCIRAMPRRLRFFFRDRENEARFAVLLFYL